jgi:pimeloyl-ACP methyl ester carboxylesterase
MTDDTAEAMRQLGIKNACVFGVSMGGMIAQSLAVKRPDLVGRLVLGSTASRISPDAARLLDSISELAGRNDTAALCEAFAKAVYTPSFYEKYVFIVHEEDYCFKQLERIYLSKMNR